MEFKFINQKTNKIVAYVVRRGYVKTIYGDVYKVEDNEIEWLLRKNDVSVGDIKAVGVLQYDFE